MVSSLFCFCFREIFPSSGVLDVFLLLFAGKEDSRSIMASESSSATLYESVPFFDKKTLQEAKVQTHCISGRYLAIPSNKALVSSALPDVANGPVISNFPPLIFIVKD